MAQGFSEWGRIFVKHGSALRRFFVRRGAGDDAEDLVQETYARMLRVRNSHGGTIANPEAYLFTVALNLAREEGVRHRQNRLQHVDIEAFSDLLQSNETIEEDALRRQRRQRVQELLLALPGHTRAVLVMQYRDGMTYQQIAERMGITVHMVKKHVVNGLAACRRAVDAEAW